MWENRSHNNFRIAWRRHDTASWFRMLSSYLPKHGFSLKTATIKRFLKTHPNFKSGSVESIKMQMEHERKDLRFLKEEMRQTDPTLTRLLKNFRSLTEWEQNFVLSVSQQFRRRRRLTDKQKRIV